MKLTEYQEHQSDLITGYIEMRPSRTETMISVAESLAKRSTCNRLNVGCVITDDHGFILSSGYNGAPLGLPHCLDVGCLIEDNHCIRSAHAEQNAIITASRNGTPLIGSTLYSTHRPCFRCLNMLIQAGIKHIIYLDGYEHDDTVLAFETCKDAGVTMKRFER